MPRFSICVASYNDAPYLEACFDSVLHQSFTDLELVFVNDGSEDDTAQIALNYSQTDKRFKLVNLESNMGTHAARKKAVMASTGDYVLFLDSDDLLLPATLERLDRVICETDSDYIHFGMLVNPEDGVSSAMVQGMSLQANAWVDIHTKRDIFYSAYTPEGGYRLDWRLAQRVYSGPIVRKAFALMPEDRMGFGEDGYEHFIVSSFVERPVIANNIVGYQYNLGLGATSSGGLGREQWREVADSYSKVINHVFEFAKTCGSDAVRRAARGFAAKLSESLMNDWHDRCPHDESHDDFIYAGDAVGEVYVAAQLMRIVRDKAYSLWVQGESITGTEDFVRWYEEAKVLGGNAAAVESSYQLYYRAAKGHMDDLKRRARMNEFENQEARIFASTHKRVDLFDSKILQPVQVGCSLRDFRFDWALHDDEGDNISSLNAMYCELTTQYWAWKNVDAPYIGFCHYRRYFDFSSEEHEENPYGEIMDGRIDSDAQRKYCLDDASIREALEGVDVVTTVIQDIRSYLGPDATLRSQYDAAPHLHVEDLDRVVDILIERHPEYAEDAKAFLAGHTGCFCNMFIMRRDIFRDYCEWLFPILQEFVETTDMSRYSREGVRTPGHLSERLLNIYMLHQEREHPEWKIRRLQCVHFQQPDYNPGLKMPVRLDDLRPIIPVVFASDNNYVPMLTTTVYSMLKNASKRYRYDITVLNRDISGENQRIMQDYFARFENVSLTFCNVSQIIDRYNLTTNNPHISVETYYRFLIQDLLPYYDKVLYLDSDLIIEGDVSELFNTDLGDNLLAAAHDIDFVANVNMKFGDRLDYATDVLGMKDPYSYFQAGVLVLNTRAMRSEYTMEQWLEFASDDRFIYNDQDVLNAHCEGKVVYLDYDWNVMIDCCGRIGNVFSYAPAPMLDAFMDSRQHEKIVHYAGVEKPWKQGSCDRSELYWRYARETPFYERLLMQPLSAPAPEHRLPDYMMHDPAISPESGLRKLIDPIAPLGSARREMGKSIIRAIRGIR